MPESDVPVGLVFKKSSYSDTGQCVEVGRAPGGGSVVGVRHSRLPDERALLFTEREWDAFVRGVKDGEFDVPAPRADT